MAVAVPPVLLIVFNRADTAARVFAEIRRARPARLFVACDGPRAGKAGEAEKVAEVRRVVTQVDWPCEVRTRFLDTNLGCGRAVSSAVGWFFSEVEEGIILEDDCLPAPAFFGYAAAMLERYRHDERVGLVTGCNMAPEAVLPHDHGFSRVINCWGWASWRRTWRDYVLQPAMIRKDEPWVRTYGRRAYRVLESCMKRIVTGDFHTWDYQFLVQMLRSGQLTVVPCHNLVLNIGFDGSGAHFTQAKRPWWAPAHAFDFHGDWRQEVPVEPDDSYDWYYKASSMGGGGRWVRLWVKLRRRWRNRLDRRRPDFWKAD